VIVDALGNPLALSFTALPVPTHTQYHPSRNRWRREKGYDADSLILSLEVHAIKAVMSSKSNREVKSVWDFALSLSTPSAIPSSDSSTPSSIIALSQYRDTLRENLTQLLCRATSDLRTH
jgi:hypothetical protein